MLLEICTNGLQSCINAEKGGANRVELCDNLLEGGTTPSFGTIEIVKQQLSIDVFVMIRPRGGDFLYSDLEFEIMKKDIEHCKKIGVEGVVFGLLNADGTIDIPRTKQLIKLAQPMKVTFHRAFDRCNNLPKGLDNLIHLGIDNVLTSGGQLKAINGLEMLKKLVQQAKNRIQIMVGSGVNSDNVHHFKNIGITNFHLSATHFIDSKMQYKQTAFDVENIIKMPAFKMRESSEEVIESVIESLR